MNELKSLVEIRRSDTLNRQPVEVERTINVNYKLSH